jgi:GTP 3',8-cyclase
MPEEDYVFTPQKNLMQVSEIETLSTIFVQEGITKIRLTGGEPLIRKDAADIILSLSRLPIHLTLTTNGTRLHEFIDVLKDADIRSLNVSLDTLNREKFSVLTRRDQFQTVYDNIALLEKNNFHVKVNMVVMKGFNDEEIVDFVEWTKDHPVVDKRSSCSCPVY